MHSQGMFDLEQIDRLLSPPGAPAYRTAQERVDLQHVEPFRFVENDVLPETATVGREHCLGKRLHRRHLTGYQKRNICNASDHFEESREPWLCPDFVGCGCSRSMVWTYSRS